MKEKILQGMADVIIDGLKNHLNDSFDEAFNFYLDMGYWLNNMCVYSFDIYLD